MKGNYLHDLKQLYSDNRTENIGRFIFQTRKPYPNFKIFVNSCSYEAVHTVFIQIYLMIIFKLKFVEYLEIP